MYKENNNREDIIDSKTQTIDLAEELLVWNDLMRTSFIIFWEKSQRENENYNSSLTNQEYNDYCKALAYLMKRTRKFGVEIKDEEIESLTFSKSLNNWYYFWESFFLTLGKEEYEQLIEDIKKGKDVSKKLPSLDWKVLENEEEPIKTKKKSTQQ